MEEPNAEVVLFSSALRELCPQQECELGIVSIESEKVFVDILSLGTSSRESFLTLYNVYIFSVEQVIPPCSWIYIKISKQLGKQ